MLNEQRTSFAKNTLIIYIFLQIEKRKKKFAIIEIWIYI